MADESVRATTIIDAPAAAIFAVLADPAKHAAIDGTGRVRGPVDGHQLTAAGQTFRMAMYHRPRELGHRGCQFPPFPPDHLGQSLAHLAGLATE